MTNHFLDIGANVGNTFDLFLNNSPEYQNYKVWCFEPSPRNLAPLIEAAQRNGNRFDITVCPFGVSGKTGPIPFYQMSNSNEGDSFIPSGLFATLDTTKQYKLLGWAMSISEFLTTYTTESDNVVLKIDCEGSEFPIHEDLLNNKYLLNRVSTIYNEWHPMYVHMTSEKQATVNRIVDGYKSIGKNLTDWNF